MTTENPVDMRRFVRHTSDVPLYVVLEGQPCPISPRLRDVGAGGISFFSDHYLAPGTLLAVSIGCLHPPFNSEGCVVWCSKGGDVFQVGIEFINTDEVFNARMVEQICHIEHYRKEVMSCEGRQLTSEEAAKEWVAKYTS